MATSTTTTTSAGPTLTLKPKHDSASSTLSTHRPAPPSPATSRRTSRSAAPSPSPSCSRILIRDYAYPTSSPLFCPPFPPNASDDEEEEEETEEDDTFKWGINRLSWTFHAGATGSVPPQGDFDRNFAYSDDDEDDEEEDEEEEEGALPPGRYRALYPFQAESASEMSLAEDEEVVVVGRGGGVGWAVVERQGGHALVPESYLQAVHDP
ncbi:hypothetical protein CPB85DRAFT_1444241 [Mucidula mucida]|nr:hypothetical protein CPB85DRAFT_1444241 [Mucidula mucida]